jgi:flavin reductase (DIM6/NTAB) family NADH-FMN oxidoreductase RutF
MADTPMSVEDGTGAFERLVATLDYPMFVVCTRAHGTDDLPAGCLVGFASQTSIHPPRFLVGLSRRNHTYRIAENATHLVVHIVSRQDRRVAELFGEQTGDRIDKFEQCDWSPVRPACPSSLPRRRGSSDASSTVSTSEITSDTCWSQSAEILPTASRTGCRSPTCPN